MASEGVALGKDKIAQLKDCSATIHRIYKDELLDEYNTFQWVVKHIDFWAEAASLGNDVKNDMNILIKGIESLNQHTLDLHTDLDAYAKEQEGINSGRVGIY